MFRAIRYHRASTDGSGPYPELRPYRSAGDPDDLFVLAVTVARSMPRWQSFDVDPEARKLRCEAVSRLFRFVDDVEIWVVAEGDESLAHIRSKSRAATGDLGVNAGRIRAYLEALEAEAANGD